MEESGRAAAYLVVLEVGESWMITECGDRDPAGARVGAILETMLAREGRRSPPLDWRSGRPEQRRGTQVRAWLPPRFLPPQLEVLRSEAPSVRMMVAPLAGFEVVPPLAAGDLAWWHADAF